jgi:hypothetical protein
LLKNKGFKKKIHSSQCHLFIVLRQRARDRGKEIDLLQELDREQVLMLGRELDLMQDQELDQAQEDHQVLEKEEEEHDLMLELDQDLELEKFMILKKFNLIKTDFTTSNQSLEKLLELPNNCKVDL